MDNVNQLPIHPTDTTEVTMRYATPQPPEATQGTTLTPELATTLAQLGFELDTGIDGCPFYTIENVTAFVGFYPREGNSVDITIRSAAGYLEFDGVVHSSEIRPQDRGIMSTENTVEDPYGGPEQDEADALQRQLAAASSLRTAVDSAALPPEYTVEEVGLRIQSYRRGDRYAVRLERIAGVPETLVGFVQDELEHGHEPAQFGTCVSSYDDAHNHLTQYMDRYRIVSIFFYNWRDPERDHWPEWVQEVAEEGP